MNDVELKLKRISEGSIVRYSQWVWVPEVLFIVVSIFVGDVFGVSESRFSEVWGAMFENGVEESSDGVLSSGIPRELYAVSPEFTPGMAIRNGPGPFSGALMIQGDMGGSPIDALTATRGTLVSTQYFYSNIDVNQGSVVLWITPEWDGDDSVWRNILIAGPTLAKRETGMLSLYVPGAGWTAEVDVSSWTAGTTYMVVASWDVNNTIDGTHYARISVNDVHTYGGIIQPSSEGGSYFAIGSHLIEGDKSIDAAIEGLTIYRRVLYDGSFGTDVGNGDEIAKIYDRDENPGNGIAPKDPTLITGSWDVTFALPTDSMVGELESGTGNAWSHPHLSNLLYTDTSDTGGFMMNGTAANDGWSLLPGSIKRSLEFDGVDDIVTIPYISDYNTTQFTLATWVKTEDSDRGDLIHRFDPSAGYALVMDPMVYGCTTEGAIGLWVADTVDGYICTTVTVNDGAWHHVAATFDGSYGEIYIDGELRASGTRNASLNTTEKMELGRDAYYPGKFFDGELDEVRVYDRVLLQSEIQETMNKLSLSPSEMSGLVGWWKFDESGVGQTVIDSSANGNDGVLGADVGVSDDDPVWYLDSPFEIGSLTGSSTSTRTDPDVLLFTFEAPETEDVRIKLVNTESSGTTNWHQVEVLPNLVRNPSLEVGGGDPWIPTYWNNDGLEAGESIWELSEVHSGSSSIKLQTDSENENVVGGVSDRNLEDKFFMSGVWAYETSGMLEFWIEDLAPQTMLYPSFITVGTSGAEWKHYGSVGREREVAENSLRLMAHSATGYFDDVYQFQLTDVPLTVTPASLEDSTENGDEIRVDGRDTYVGTGVGSLKTGSGYLAFDYRPRHSAATAVAYDESNDDAYVVSLTDSDHSDYVDVYWDSANTLKLTVDTGGGEVTDTWDATGVVVGGIQYEVIVRYSEGGTVSVDVDGAERMSVAMGDAFDEAPDDVYFGSSYQGTHQGDATFSGLLDDDMAPVIVLNDITPDPHNDSTPVITGVATDGLVAVVGVEFQVDGTEGVWSTCEAADGLYDEAVEAFECVIAPALSDGVHVVYVRAEDSVGNITLPGSEPSDEFEIDTVSEVEYVKLGGWQVSSGDVVESTEARPEFSGVTEPGSEVTIEIWSDVVTGVVTADEDGRWSWRPGEDLEVGEHVVRITTVDLASNETVVEFTYVLLGELTDTGEGIWIWVVLGTLSLSWCGTIILRKYL